MNVKESAKDKLFNQLDICLNALGSYDINSLMPLLYVVVAHHKGHLISIVGESGNLFSGKMHIQSIEAIDGCESELLKEIRLSVNPSYFEGQSAEIVFRFYETCNEFIKTYYQDIIEHIISYYSSRGGRYAGMAITPLGVAHLMSKIIEEYNPSKIYDPCAGLCTYSLVNGLKNVPFVGQEISSFTKVIADVRLDAAGKSAIVFNEDSTLVWRDKDDCDVLASELPFGVRLYDHATDHNRPRLLEDYVLYKFIKTPSIKKAVLLVSMATCFRRENFDIRKTLCERNWIDSIIKLPVGILPYAGVSTAIIVLNKERVSNEINFILAEDCIINERKNRVLDYQSVLDRIAGTDEKQSAMVSVNETFDRDCSLEPSAYVQKYYMPDPYDRLIKIYSKAKLFDEEKRILLLGIDHFRQLRTKRKEYVLHLAQKYNATDFATERIDNGKKITYFNGVFELYNPFPIVEKWQERAEKKRYLLTSEYNK